MFYRRFLAVCFSMFTIIILVIVCAVMRCAYDISDFNPSDAESGNKITFSDGITLEVPSGDLKSVSDVTVEILNSSGFLDSIVSQSGLKKKRLMAAFIMQPVGFSFDERVIVTIPSRPHTARGLPFLFVLDTTVRRCSPAYTELISDPDSGVVRVTLSSCSTYAVAEITGVLQDSSLAKTCDTSDCRNKRVTVKEVARDYNSQTGINAPTCVISRIDGSADYHDCKGLPTETWSFHEVSDICKPELTITAQDEFDCGSAPFEVAFKITLGGEPLQNQFMTLTTNDPSDATITPGTGETLTDGTLKGTLSPGQKDVTVYAVAFVEYLIKYIAVNGEVQQSESKQETLRESKTIKLNPRVSVSAAELSIGEDDNTEITATVECGDNKYEGTVSFSVAPAYGTVSPASAPLSNNKATTTFTGTEEGTATITATFTNSGGGSGVSRDTEIHVGCGADSVLVAYAKEIYDEFVQKYHFGTTWSVEIESYHLYDSSCGGNWRTSLHQFWEESCTGRAELNTTTNYILTVPQAPDSFTCEDIKMYENDIQDIELAKQWIAFDFYWKVDSVLTPFFEEPLFGIGTHWTAEDGPWYTQKSVVDLCGVHENPCDIKKVQFSGCPKTDGSHTTTAELFFSREGEDLALIDVYLDIEVLDYTATPEELPIQTAEYTDLSNDVDFDITSYQTDENGMVVGCTSTPKCIGGPHEDEEACGIEFYPDGISFVDDTLRFIEGTYEYSNDDGTYMKKVTLTCTGGCQ